MHFVVMTQRGNDFVARFRAPNSHRAVPARCDNEAAILTEVRLRDARSVKPHLPELRGVAKNRGDADAVDVFALRLASFQAQCLHKPEQRSE